MKQRQRGVTLIEVLVFIVVISVGLSGLLVAFDINVRHSADPMVRKQLVSIAESMLDEVLAQPITGDGVRPAGGATQANRAAGLFDEVDDYNGYGVGLVGVYAIDGVLPINGLSAYGLTVTVDSAATLSAIPARKVTVAVSGSGESFSLAGYRTNYAE